MVTRLHGIHVGWDACRMGTTAHGCTLTRGRGEANGQGVERLLCTSAICANRVRALSVARAAKGSGNAMRDRCAHCRIENHAAWDRRSQTSDRYSDQRPPNTAWIYTGTQTHHARMCDVGAAGAGSAPDRWNNIYHGVDDEIAQTSLGGKGRTRISL
jgi:hypothetical protein